MTIAGLTPEAEAALGKVRKLLDKAADRGVTDAEREAFQAKAEEVMLRHNLDAATVERESGAAGRRERALVEGGFYRWQRDLWEDVAELNFCLYWSQVCWARVENARRKGRYGGTYVTDVEVRRRRHALVGRTVNVRTTESTARYLEAAIARATAERFPDPGAPGSHVASYREGLAYRLGQRLRARRRALLEEERKAADARDRAANAAARGGVPTSTALTVTAYARSEKDANIDFRYGEGTSARWRAEREAAAAEARAAHEEYTRWAAANPEEARAKEEAEREKAEVRERAASRQRFGGVRSDTMFWRGVEDGERISLDPQVDGGGTSPKKLTSRRG